MWEYNWTLNNQPMINWILIYRLLKFPTHMPFLLFNFIKKDSLNVVPICVICICTARDQLRCKYYANHMRKHWVTSPALEYMFFPCYT